MTDKKIWFVTGAGRGLGVDIAKAALAAGHAVIATGRTPEKVTAALGDHDDLFVTKLDVTVPADAEAAVQAAVERFGRIDVVVNNAANFYAGFFEEITPDDFRAQVETTLFGPVNSDPRGAAGDALPALGARHDDLVDRRNRRLRRLRHRLRRVEVRRRGLDGSAQRGDRPVRHPHDARRARVLPHRAPHPRVHELRPLHDRRLHRTRRGHRRRVGAR